MNQADSLVIAVGATASLMLVNRGMRRFHMSFEMKAWMAFAWLLIIVAGMLIASALRACNARATCSCAALHLT